MITFSVYQFYNQNNVYVYNNALNSKLLTTMKMKFPQASLMFLLISLLFSVSCATSNSEFVTCFNSLNADNPTTITSEIIHTTNFSSILESSINNLRFNSPTTIKPQLIVTPLDESHVQATIICSKKLGLQLRVRSGGHDYEGLSYASDTPGTLFVLIDLVNLRKVHVDVKEGTALVQAGAMVGDVYYGIAKQSKVHAFPAGVCPSMGMGGHVSGGGQGVLMRKYGLSADNIIDATIVNANGEVLDRKSMGESLFWAIRGGGGASFGVILSWKIKLVDVPPVVTVSSANRILEDGAKKMVYRWQEIAHKFDDNLFMRIYMTSKTNSQGDITFQVKFQTMFLGTTKELLPLMNKSFPELGLKESECTEMSWINSTKFFYGYSQDTPTEILTNRTAASKSYFKGKSDFVKTPIPEDALDGLFNLFLQDNTGTIIWDPYGAKMGNISKTATPFPHRGGILYNIQYINNWKTNDTETSKSCMDWISKVYNYLTPYVTNSPRSAYLNYKDLDLGRNGGGYASYSNAITWGSMYFGSNFERLAKVKAAVDPEDFFRDEQSIPVFSTVF